MKGKAPFRIQCIITVSTVFILSAIRLWGFLIQDINNPPIFESYGDYYMVYYYVIENNLIDLIISVLLISRAYMFKACLYTIIATWLYFLLALLSLSHVFIQFNYMAYISAFTWIIYCGIILMALISFTKCLRSK